MSRDEQSVHVERSGRVATITICRPKALNALNSRVLSRIGDAVRSAETDPAIRAVIVTGEGDKAFSAGADLAELQGVAADRVYSMMVAGQAVMRAIARARIPVIAAVNGLALGGGFELALACTFPVLSVRASFGLPEAGLGLIPGYGGTQRLPAAIGPRVAAYLMLTGQRLAAARAFDLGLTPVPPVPADELLAVAGDIAATIATRGPAAVRMVLTAMGAARAGGADTGLGLETSLASLAVGGAESTEGIRAFFAHETPDFDRGVGES